MITKGEKAVAKALVKKGFLTGDQASAVFKDLKEKWTARSIVSFMSLCSERWLLTPEQIAALSRDGDFLTIYGVEDALYIKIALENELISSEKAEEARGKSRTHLVAGTIIRLFEILSVAGYISFPTHEKIIKTLGKVQEAKAKDATASLKIDDGSEGGITLAEPPPRPKESEMWTIVLRREGEREMSRLTTEQVEDLIRLRRLRRDDLIERAVDPVRVEVGTIPTFWSVLEEVSKEDNLLTAGAKKKKLLIVTAAVAAAVVIVIVAGFYAKGKWQKVAGERAEDEKQSRQEAANDLFEEYGAIEALLEKGSDEDIHPWVRARARVLKLRTDLKGEMSKADHAETLDDLWLEIEELIESDVIKKKATGLLFFPDTGEWMTRRAYIAKMERKEIEKRRGLGYVYIDIPGATPVEKWVHPDEAARLKGYVDWDGRKMAPWDAAISLLENIGKSYYTLMGYAPVLSPDFTARDRIIAGADPGVIMGECLKPHLKYTADSKRMVSSALDLVLKFLQVYDHATNPDPVDSGTFSSVRNALEKLEVYNENLSAGKVIFEQGWATVEDVENTYGAELQLARAGEKWIPACLVPFYTEAAGIEEYKYRISLKTQILSKVYKYEYVGDELLVWLARGSKTPLRYAKSDVVKIVEEQSPGSKTFLKVKNSPLTSSIPFIEARKEFLRLRMDEWAELTLKVIHYIDPGYYDY